jgi:hypothetical protein
VVSPVIVSKRPKNAEPKKGRKGRKIGKGVRKVAHSRWSTYANLIAHCKQRREQSIKTRTCLACDKVFHSHNAAKRHICL